MIFTTIEISDNDYKKLGSLLTKKYGIKLSPEKKIMFQARLQSRLRTLNMNSFEEYAEFIDKPSNTDAELDEMIEFISTNKTEFFREQSHFDFLYEEVLSFAYAGLKHNDDAVLKCWSAGCSKGQEAFTMAMVIERFRMENKVPQDFFILGTDVSGKVLNIAQQGTYPFPESKAISDFYLKNYVLRSKDPKEARIKIMKLLRSKVLFRFGNLMDEDYQIKDQFQIIFLRNTLIYFNQENQTMILRKVLRHLIPGGFLFIGHSESLINRDLPIEIIAPSVYQKINP